MPDMKPVAVQELALDLGNYRTVRQLDEDSAVVAMISTSPDRFWALTESLLRDGYLPTENILVLRTSQPNALLTVKEGNRRIAALKLIHGLLPPGLLDPPENISEQIKKVSKEWRKNNSAVPCTIYSAAQAAIVDRIVTLAHGKGEKAGRDQWNAVARARHNRDANEDGEPGLDLLEKYLEAGRNVTSRQRAQWAGEYPLSVLAEAIKRLAPRLGVANSPGLAKQYPAIKNRDAVEAILHDIGQGNLGFDKIRQRDMDFAAAYGMPSLHGEEPAPKGGSKNSGTGSGGGGGGAEGGATGKGRAEVKPKALAISDPRAVRRILRDFVPMGKNREKVVTLRDEAVKLDLAKTPLAFCFVLRSMFEISAKAYCTDHRLSSKKAGGQDKSLVEILRVVTDHLTKGNTDREIVKFLHGAMTELGKPDGLLSVTSMNQLVHNPRFSPVPSDIAILFGNILPLLEAMNN
jgi:hypothetical protein